MILGDYHTHTVYSHGKGLVAENVAKAAEMGLKEIAITDHGFFHKAYALRRMDLNDFLCDVNNTRNKYRDIKILAGMEANLLNSRGDIDIKESDYGWIDVLLCGHHKFTRGAGFKEKLTFSLPVFMAGLLHKSSAKRVFENTEAFIKAMDKHPIDIITHPNLGIAVDFRELGKAAKHYGVLLEINGKGARFNEKQANEALEQGADFIVNSDAHSPTRVGDFNKSLDFIKRAGIPLEKIVNYNKIPGFKAKERKKL